SKLPPGQQALLPKRHLTTKADLTTKAAQPHKGNQKKGEGIDPILEHNGIHKEPHCMKPPLPTHQIVPLIKVAYYRNIYVQRTTT
ncbi:MAG: hypothetical protein ACKPKO_26100, partial [Candidatus Fonsibacter sp.]